MNDRILKRTLASGSVDSVLEGIRISGLDLSGLRIRSSLVRAQIDRSNLDNVDASSISESDIYGCKCRGFRVSNLSETSIVKSHLFGAKLDIGVWNCQFDNVDMRCARFAFPVSGIRPWSGNTFVDADLRGLDAAGCPMSDSRFERCRFDGARLSRASWSGVEKRSCSFSLVNAIRSVGTDEVAIRESLESSRSFRRRLHLFDGLSTKKADEIERASDGDVGIRWVFVSRGGVENNMFLWVDRSVTKDRGVAISSEADGVFRSYNWSNRRSLRSVFQDMIADYWDWVLVCNSIRVDGTRERGGKLMAMFTNRLRELFVSV